MFIEKKIQLPEESVAIEELWPKIKEALFGYSIKLSDAVNGGMRLNENIDCKVVTFTSDSANEVQVSHGLKRTPVGYIVIKNPNAGGTWTDVWDGDTAWDSEYIYFWSNTDGSTITVLVF